MSVASQKRRPLNVDLSRGKREKSARSRSGDYGGCCSVVTLFVDKKFLPKSTCALEHCREVEAFGSPFFGAFSSDGIPKATKDVNVHVFTHNFTFRDELIDNPLAVKNTLNYISKFR